MIQRARVPRDTIFRPWVAHLVMHRAMHAGGRSLALRLPLSKLILAL